MVSRRKTFLHPAIKTPFRASGSKVLSLQLAMRKIFKDIEHLMRLVVVLAAGVLVFLVARRVLVPPGFGQYGHYRPGALDDNRVRPVKFAGRTACELCHEDIVTTKKAGKHVIVGCEACHGPLAQHTEDPTANKPKRPNAATLCVRCHEADPAKPKAFPQVASKEHSGGEICSSCHNPHKPKP